MRASVNKWVRRLFLLLTTCFLLPNVTACAGAAPVVKVGLVAPFEGRNRPIGYDVLYSARLAVREINAAGGIGGYRVALVALDDSGDPALAVQTAESLMIDPGVVAVVGHWLPETTNAAAPVYTAAGVTFLPGGEMPYGAGDPNALPGDFVDAYTAVTPFDETPGPYAGSTYAAFQELWRQMESAYAASGAINRASLADIR